MKQIKTIRSGYSETPLQRGILLALALLFQAGICVIDLHTGPIFAFGAVYTLVVLYAWLLPWKRAVLVAALLSTLLVIGVGYYKLRLSEGDYAVVINRSASVLAIWIAALLVMLARRSYAELERTVKQLNEMVDLRTEQVRERLLHTEIQQSVLEHQRDDLRLLNEKLEQHSERLRASESRFRQLLHNAPIGIVILDKHGLIDHANEQFREIFQLGQYYSSTTFFSSLLQEEEREGFQAFVSEFRANRTQSREKREFDAHVGGRALSLGINLSFLEDDRSDYLVCAVTDITNRKKKERLLIRAREMEARNAELEHLTHLASHDLQEPLKTLEGFVNLFELKYKQRLDEVGLAYLQHMKQSTTRMSRLIRYLLDYSQIGTKPTEAVDLNEVLQQVKLDLSASIEQSRAELHVLPLPVLEAGNRIELGILFQNLLKNAMKFVAAGVKPRIEVGCTYSEQGFACYVQDNGIGISEAHRLRIFQMFQRLHGSDQYAGSGIGLAFCKKIVEAHGGHIKVAAAPGGGSTFWFTLSSDAELPSEPEASAAP